MIIDSRPPIQLHVPLDGPSSSPAGDDPGRRVLRENSLRTPGRASSCRTRTICADYHAEDQAYWENVYYWNTPLADCGDDRGEVCKIYRRWRSAWTEIKG